jgi:hypothetical protein
MMGWWAASILAAATTLWSQAGALKGGPSLAFSADFVLKTTDSQGSESAAGVLRLTPGGEVCVTVKTPRVQEMRLSAREMVIYYPDRDLALIATLSPQQAPPMLDAIAAGVVDPGSTLPGPSKLVEQRHADGKLFTRWKVVDGSGQDLGEMRAVESRDGTISVALSDTGGAPQRRFSFADRIRVAGRSVPRAVSAEYFAAGGAFSRREQWTLENVARFDQRPTSGCARIRPQTKVQTLQW